MYDIPRISSEYLLNDLAKYEGKIWELIGVSNLQLCNYNEAAKMLHRVRDRLA